MLFVQTEGNAYDRGRQYGRRLAAQITRRAPARPLQPRAAATEADHLAGNMLRYLDAHEPGLIEEMSGMAEGADVPFEAVFHLNVASFVRYIQDYTVARPAGEAERPQRGVTGRDEGSEQGGCTNVAFTQTDVGPLLGKTNDGGAPVPPEAQPDTWVLQQARPSGGPAFLVFAPVGALSGVAGLNEAGFGAGQSAAQVVPNQSGDGVPSNLLLRPLLERCQTVADALAVLGERTMAGKGLNIMLLDAGGSVRAAERSGTLLGVREPDGSGVLYFSNHCHTPGLRDLPPRPDRANSVRRWEFLRRRFGEGTGEVERTRQGMAALISSHGEEGGRGAICQHGPDMFTSLGLLMAPRERTVWVADGPPCSAPFVAYHS